MQKSAKYKPLDFKHKAMFLEGCTAGGGRISETVHERKKLRITDHEYRENREWLGHRSIFQIRLLSHSR